LSGEVVNRSKNVSLARRALRENYERNKNEENTYDSTADNAHAEVGSAGASGKAGEARSAVCSRTARAGAVPVMQTRMGRSSGKNAERARHAICVPVLPAFAPRPGTCARIPQNAARAMDQAAPG
jgi:hypothetical protein